MGGDADVMLAGGAEAACCRIGMAGFAAARALSTNFNDNPKHSSRPWDEDRDGFVMGEGASRAMLSAIKDAGISTTDLDYINAHGTSTPLGDIIELRAIGRILGQKIENTSISSTKSATGHLLGAAGAIEAIYSILSIVNQTAPPTNNL